MRRTIACCLLIAAVAGGATPPGAAILTFLQGTGQVSPDGAKWQPLKQGGRITAGQFVRTGANSRAELAFSDGSVVRLAPNSKMKLQSDGKTGNGLRTWLQGLAGHLWTKVTKGRGQFAVTSPHAVAAVTGTEFDVNVAEDRTATSVYEGSVGVQVEPPDGESADSLFDRAPQPAAPAAPQVFGKPTVIAPPVHVVPGPHQVSRDEWLAIVANQQIEVFKNGDAFVREIMPGGEADREWVEWNRRRDRASGQ